MPDIEKVIKGIFEMLQRNTWKDIDEYRHRFQPVLNDALKLLKDSVPQSVVDQIRWERDTALSQLKEIGKGLGEKMDDVKPRAQPKWIPVSEGMPEEHDSIFAKWKGTDKWRSAMFEKMSDDVRIVVVFPDGTRRVSHSHTVDGKWECEKSPVKRTVTHWMPNPAMPKAGEQ